MCRWNNTYFSKSDTRGNKSYNKKTGTPTKPYRCKRTSCKRKKTIFCSDLTITSDGLGDFISLGKSVNSVGNIAGKQILNNPARAIELAAARSTTATTKKPRSCAATAYQVLEFTGQGTGSYLGEMK